MSASSAVPFVYLGTSDFAASVLEDLAGSPHTPALVVTPPDRRSGRGRRVSPPPVADAARDLGIELHQTSSVNEDASRKVIRASGAGLGVVCAFGQLIGADLLGELPMLNAHPSLLPRWRGAAPVERSIMAGDTSTGTCVMRLTEGLDSGPVALREETAIGDTDTYGSLAPALAGLSGRLLIEALDLEAAGQLESRFAEQPEDGVTYAEKIEREDRLVDTSRTAAEEDRRIRALTPHIGAAVELSDGERLGLRSGGVAADGPARGAFAESEGELLLGCAEGAVRVGELQPAGGRWMLASDYLRGRGVPTP